MVDTLPVVSQVDCCHRHSCKFPVHSDDYAIVLEKMTNSRRPAPSCDLYRCRRIVNASVLCLPDAMFPEIFNTCMLRPRCSQPALRDWMITRNKYTVPKISPKHQRVFYVRTQSPAVSSSNRPALCLNSPIACHKKVM